MYHLHNTTPTNLRSIANFSSVIQQHPPSLLNKGGFVLSSGSSSSEVKEEGGRRERERWDIRGVCQATRTSSLPPSADLDVPYCVSVSHVLLSHSENHSICSEALVNGFLHYHCSLPPKEAQTEAARWENVVSEMPSTPKFVKINVTNCLITLIAYVYIHNEVQLN